MRLAADCDLDLDVFPARLEPLAHRRPERTHRTRRPRGRSASRGAFTKRRRDRDANHRLHRQSIELDGITCGAGEAQTSDSSHVVHEAVARRVDAARGPPSTNCTCHYRDGARRAGRFCIGPRRARHGPPEKVLKMHDFAVLQLEITPA